MNFSLPIGFILGIGIITWAIIGEIGNPQIFFNPHAIAVVIGGTFATSLICFPFEHLVNIVRVMMKSAFGQYQTETIDTINEIVAIAQRVSDNEPLEDQVAPVVNTFLKECLTLAIEGTISEEELEGLCYKRVEIQNEKYKQEGITFKIIGKFPPAFGLVGTTLGMIALLQSLGGENAFQKLGPSMSVALTATFWGLVVANLFLIPLGENLALASQHDLIRRKIVVEGVMLIKEKKHPIIIEEHLKSYLSPALRNRIKGMA